MEDFQALMIMQTLCLGGNQKKGRTSIGPRDVKKIRSSNEAEFDEEDDPDMGLR